MKLIISVFFLFMLTLQQLQAKEVAISGKVINRQQNRGVAGASVAVLETRQKFIADDNGLFSGVINTELNQVTLLVQSASTERKQQTFDLSSNAQNLSIFVEPLRLRGKTLNVTTKRELQSVSRSTVTKEEIKDAPATLGDSLSALTTLPGIIRPNGFFGPLIIRGAAESANRYLIDDIPIFSPQHFGALQSIISNEMISQINVFSSAFPVDYGQATGAIIEMETEDNVKEFKAVLDFSLISGNAYLSGVWFNNGYWQAAARFGYLSYVIPIVYKIITGETLLELPEYYDYQWKSKFFLDAKAQHSLTLLLFGSFDTFRLLQDEPTPEEKQQAIDEGADPLNAGASFRNAIYSNYQGVYYRYQPSEKFGNSLIFYNVLVDSLFYVDAPEIKKNNLQEKSINVKNNPNITAVKDKIFWEIIPQNWDVFFSLEAQYYWNKASGTTQVATTEIPTGGQPDLGDDSLFATAPLDFQGSNLLFSSYLKNTVNLGIFSATLGLRSESLSRTKEVTLDPRGLFEAKLSPDFKIAVGAGQYSSFAQVNQAYFNKPFQQNPAIVVADYIKPERANHYIASSEWKLNLLFFKLEVFYSDFFDSIVEKAQPAIQQYFVNSSRANSKGAEFLIRKDRAEDSNDFYGWVSYTYTDAKSQNDPSSSYRSFEFEQPHNLKLVLGYVYERHTLGVRFELNSGFPYTPVVGSQELIPGRYSQVYGSPYSQRYPLSHRLDIRYTYKADKSWGRFSYYVELINAYNYSPISTQSWKFNKPYAEGENPVLSSSPAVTLLPNFGFEWKF